MLTPAFELTQNDKEVIIVIKAPYAKVSVLQGILKSSVMSRKFLKYSNNHLIIHQPLYFHA